MKHTLLQYFTVHLVQFHKRLKFFDRTSVSLVPNDEK